jgi:aldehyde dehydrogenase (NAD+)
MKNFLEDLKISQTNAGVSTGIHFWEGKGPILTSISPVNNKEIGNTTIGTVEDYDKAVQKASEAFLTWRLISAPKRGEIVRQMGESFRKNKESLGRLVSFEMGKSLQEGLGEVQEIIDICDFAVGLSRQLYGLTMHSERPFHRMYEQWHPLGVVGIISSFNFPVAVWSWNSMIAWVCGNTCVWKPSEKTPLSAIACQNIINEVLVRNNVPEGVSCLVVGDAEIGKEMAKDHRIALVSATGSTKMGKSVGQEVAGRLGKYLLELGGNNAIIITESADLKLVIPGVVFGAVGTAGQRCTTTRRLIVHHSIKQKVIDSLTFAYGQIKIGDPLDQENHMGPLIDEHAVENYTEAIETAIKEGGKLIFGGKKLEDLGKCYVQPTIIEVEKQYNVVCTETFAPILYVMGYDNLDQALALQNGVPQGLSSAIFTQNIKESEKFLSAVGSDCGIANVNIGTSGAEIGGAFGGEKETGGGRESGSDAWKAYMRRQTNTINYGDSLPLAQGIKFDF